MNITVKPEQEQFIQAKLKSGKSESISNHEVMGLILISIEYN